MKRQRPEPMVMTIARANGYFGKTIPPGSLVKLTANWGNDQGRTFRIGYYRHKDGLNCVWLVNEAGDYEQTTDQKSIETDFEVLKFSTETDMYGVDRDVLGPIMDTEAWVPELMQ